MGLKGRATKADIAKAFQQKAQAVDQAILMNFRYLGELCVNLARSTDTYHDQTGNLRNSIGYVIVKNGQVIEGNFTRTASGSGAEGQATGSTLARNLAGEYPTGYALIVVAGMNYAASVEARGLDVLSSAELLAETELPRMLRELKIDIASRS